MISLSSFEARLIRPGKSHWKTSVQMGMTTAGLLQGGCMLDENSYPVRALSR